MAWHRQRIQASGEKWKIEKRGRGREVVGGERKREMKREKEEKDPSRAVRLEERPRIYGKDGGNCSGRVAVLGRAENNRNFTDGV